MLPLYNTVIAAVKYLEFMSSKETSITVHRCKVEQEIIKVETRSRKILWAKEDPTFDLSILLKMEI